MAVVIVIAGIALGWVFAPVRQQLIKPKSKPRPGRYTNRKGKHYRITSNGGLEVDAGALLSSPEVQKQLKGFQQLYMSQTIMALWQGQRPPHSVGKYGTLTKKKLIIEWNDEWQAEMDKLSEYHDISYNILFAIPEEHPESGIIYTADEIARQYGGEKESS